MANNEIKTNAEIYREQRKANLEKAKKKNKSGKADKAIRIVVKVVSIILVVALVLFGIARVLTNVFCVPQKVLTAAKYGDDKINVAEYNFYYFGLYNQAANVAAQYDQQFQGYGTEQYFNVAVSPADQKYPGDDAPKGVKTWADYFKHFASEKAFITNEFFKAANSEEAKKAGFKLTKEQKDDIKKQLDDHMKELGERAKRENFSLNNYIARICGEGLNEKTYRALLEKDMISRFYLQWYQENAGKTISKADIDKYYNANRSDIDLASFRFFGVSYAKPEKDSKDPAYTKAEAKERAENFLSELTNEAEFEPLASKYAPPSLKDAYKQAGATHVQNIKKANLESLSDKMAKWIFDTSRKYGDTAIFDADSQSTYYVVYVTKPAHKDTAVSSASVRHLLVEAKTTKEDAQGKQTPLSSAEIEKNFAEAKKEADAILKEWKNGKATEETFIELVKEKTDDTASKETGGLYENINSESQYVPEFLNWALANHKKGDVEIVKTDYGYHIMYYVGADKTEKWESDIRNILANDNITKYTDDIANDITKNIKRNEAITNYFAKRIEKTIDKYARMAASQQSQAPQIQQ